MKKSGARSQVNKKKCRYYYSSVRNRTLSALSEAAIPFQKRRPCKTKLENAQSGFLNRRPRRTPEALQTFMNFQRAVIILEAVHLSGNIRQVSE